MPLKQVGRGLTKEQREQSKRRKEQRNKRKRERKKISNKRKQALREQGYELKNRIFLDTNNPGILRQLKLETSYNVSKYIVDAHGAIMDDHFKVPDNIVLLYLGVIGNITFTNSLKEMNDICEGSVIPNTIILPGEKAPNVSLSGEYNQGQISGIFECGSVHKRVLNNYLVPNQDVIDSYNDDEMFDVMKDPDTGKYPISTENNYRTTLKKTVRAISKLLNKNTYAFVYLESCLGGMCNLPLSNEEFNTIVNSEKFNTLRTGDTLYNQDPHRLKTKPGVFKHGDYWIKIRKMELAKDDDHQGYRIMLKNSIEDYDFYGFVFIVYDYIESYYEYDINDLEYFKKLALHLEADIDDVHFSSFINTHLEILKAFTKQDRDKIFKLTRRENALRSNINPAKYSFLALKYGMTDIPLEDIPLQYGDKIQVSINMKNISDFAKKLSKKKPMFSGMFLKELWEYYVKNPLLKIHEDVFYEYWFEDQEKLENLKKKARLTRSEDTELKTLQRQHDYYTITSLMNLIIETIDLYNEKSEEIIDAFKSVDIPSYNMVYAKELMTMAIEYVGSDAYKRREIAFKDKIIKQLEEMNSMIENHGSQAGGGGDDFLTSLFRFFGF